MKKTDDMKLRSIFSALLLTGVLTVSARDFVHPGMSYTIADLDRMRQMIASRTEPYYSTFQALKESAYSKVSTTAPEPITAISEGKFNSTIGVDGRRVHDLALLYRLTDDESYADYAVKLLNRYKDLTMCAILLRLWFITKISVRRQCAAVHPGHWSLRAMNGCRKLSTSAWATA